MVDSVQKTARDAIKTWIESLALVPAPTVVQVEEPEPDAKRTLPTIEVSFGAEAWNTQQRTDAGSIGERVIWDYGETEAEGAIIWRAKSEAEAEAFREQFRGFFLLAAEASGTVADTPVLKLPATFFGAVTDDVLVYFQKAGNLKFAERRETGVVDYWVLAHAVMVTYPLLVLEPDPGTGIMNVLIEAGQADIDPFDMNDLHPDA